MLLLVAALLMPPSQAFESIERRFCEHTLESAQQMTLDPRNLMAFDNCLLYTSDAADE